MSKPKTGWGLTDAQHYWLHWLHKHGGTGVLDRRDRMLAQGEVADAEKKSWFALQSAGLIEFMGRRAGITDKGYLYVRTFPGKTEWEPPAASPHGPYMVDDEPGEFR